MNALRILSVEPPAARRVGGIDTALDGWSEALRREGLDVVRGETPAETELARADIVHFHGLWERPHAALRDRCRRLGKPFVVSPHGMLEPWAFAHKRWKKVPYFHFCERRGLNAAACLLATSEAEAHNLRRWFAPGHIRVIPLGLPETPGPDHAAAREALGWTEDERVVLFLSRLHAKKGLHVLVDAWPGVVAKASRPVRLVIVGEGDPDYVEPLRRRAATLPGSRIDWAGPRWGEAKWPWLQGADVFCLPTFSENFGLVVPESLLVGTPVVTTPGTPWAELARGLPIAITEPTAESMAEALSRAVDAPVPSAVTRRETHEEVARRFGWSRLAKDYAALYRSVVAPHI